MPPVQTTQTVIDAQREHKELRAAITVLTGKIEDSERIHKEVLGATESLRAEQERIKAALQNDRDSTFQILEEARQLVGENMKLLKESDVVVEGTLKFIGKLELTLQEISDQIRVAEKRKEEVHAEIVADQEHFEINKKDLRILTKRLQDRIDEYGLGNEIKITLT